MSTREAVQTILSQLPSDVSLHEVARELEFIAAVREGMAELDRGEGIPITQVRNELSPVPKWHRKVLAEDGARYHAHLNEGSPWSEVKGRITHQR